MDISEFIIIILSSGFVAAMVSATMQKKNERETRIFNAKLEAYKDFISHVKGCYRSFSFKEKDMSIFRIAEISAYIFLVSNDEINEKVKEFNSLIRKAYEIHEKGKSPGKIVKEKIFPLGEEIEKLMRKDLGF